MADVYNFPLLPPDQIPSLHSGDQNFRTLLDFSLGRIEHGIALDRLGIDSQEDLFLLVTQASLPMPRLPEADTRHMADGLHQLVP